MIMSWLTIKIFNVEKYIAQLECFEFVMLIKSKMDLTS